MQQNNDPGLALVTGASGFVGSHVVRLLVQRGRRVRVLLRASSSRDALADLPVEIEIGDVLDPASLRAAMRGCATVFHSVVDPRFWLTDQTPIFRNNVEGLRNAMEAALAENVGRFVFTSTMGTLGIDPGVPVTEDTPFNWSDRAPPYIQARKQAEDLFLSFCRDRGLPGVALCVANTYGPQDFQPTPHNGHLWSIAAGRTRSIIDVGQPTVDIRDVAEAALLAETRGRVGERYIIANRYLRAREFASLMVSQRGHVMPRIVPYAAAYASAWVGERVMRLLRRRDSMMRADAVFLAGVFGPLDNSKARRELGWSPRPIEQTVRDAVDWFEAREKRAGGTGAPRAL